MQSDITRDDLIRQIYGLLRALGVVVSGGRLVAGPAVPIAPVKASPDPLQRKWVAAGITVVLTVLLSGVVRTAVTDYRKRDCWKPGARFSCPAPIKTPYTIWELKHGIRRP